MAEWEGKSKGTPLGYKIFIFLIKNVGLSAAYLLLYPVVAWYFLFAKKANMALNQYFNRVKIYFTNPPATSRFKTFYNMGQVLIDKTAIISGAESDFSVFRDGGHNLVAMSENKTGGFLISAHAGNWEIAGHLMQHLTTPVNIVLLDGEDEQIKKVMSKATGKRHFNIIAMKDDMSHIFKIHQAAQNKELICIHGDRFLPGSKTLTGTFLGEDALFPMGPFAMAAKMNLPVSFVFGMKEKKSKYHFYCTDPIVGETDQKAIFKAYLNKLEKIVYEYPNQWYNFYPFWKNDAQTPAKSN
jgi:predicted LPLAT superfamily acyltransferase